MANNPLKFIDPDGEEKIQVIITTFIPDKSVTAGGRTFSGDGRNVGDPGSYRTQQVISIETDASKGAAEASPAYKTSAPVMNSVGQMAE